MQFWGVRCLVLTSFHPKLNPIESLTIHQALSKFKSKCKEVMLIYIEITKEEPDLGGGVGVILNKGAFIIAS